MKRTMSLAVSRQFSDDTIIHFNDHAGNHIPDGTYPRTRHKRGSHYCYMCLDQQLRIIRHRVFKRYGKWYLTCPAFNGSAYLDITQPWQETNVSDVAARMHRHVKYCPMIKKFLEEQQRAFNEWIGSTEFSKLPKILPPITTDSGTASVQNTKVISNSTWSSAVGERIKKWFT